MDEFAKGFFNLLLAVVFRHYLILLFYMKELLLTLILSYFGFCPSGYWVADNQIRQFLPFRVHGG